MNGAIGERRRERVVDEPVLLDEREPRKARACHSHVEVVAAARPILDRDLLRVGERLAEKLFQPGSHRPDDSEREDG